MNTNYEERSSSSTRQVKQRKEENNNTGGIGGSTVEIGRGTEEKVAEEVEIWKDIDGYYGRYLISNTGKVRSNFSNKILKPAIGKWGYLFVTLFLDYKGTSKFIHRLIAEYFIPNPNNYEIVDHKDRNRINNSISNLRWVDKAANIMNCSLSKNNKTGVNGVYWVKAKKKWRAEIMINYKKIHLGYYEEFSSACFARRCADAKYWKEFKERSVVAATSVITP